MCRTVSIAQTGTAEDDVILGPPLLPTSGSCAFMRTAKEEVNGQSGARRRSEGKKIFKHRSRGLVWMTSFYRDVTVAERERAHEIKLRL